MTLSKTIVIGQQLVSDGATGVRVDVHASPRFSRISTLPRSSPYPPFTGRGDCLRLIEEALDQFREAVLCGHPGVGKSRIATEYARRYHARYPGGTFFLSFERGTPPTGLEILLRDFDAPADERESYEDRCRRALRMIATVSQVLGPALVLYDGVPDLEAFREWMPPESPAVYLLATTAFRGALDEPSVVIVDHLSRADASQLTSVILGDLSTSDKYREQLIERAAGITVELCASAQAVRSALRRGRQTKVDDALAKATNSSFEIAWRLLSEKTCLLMKIACTFAARRAPVALIRNVLMASGWSSEAVAEHVDAARESGLANGLDDDLEIHQLVAEFVRTITDASLATILPVLWKEFHRIATKFAEHPNQAEFRTLLLTHQLELSAWYAYADDCATVGRALLEAGRYVHAQQWLARAITQCEERSEPTESILADLSRAYVLIGHDYLRRGDNRGAHDSYRRAAEVAPIHVKMLFETLANGDLVKAQTQLLSLIQVYEHPDAQGEINHDRLASLVQALGLCLWKQGVYDAAISCFERASKLRLEPDTRGRVDHESVAVCHSLSGEVYLEQRRFSEAQLQFERAVVELDQGDEYGRINYDSRGLSAHQVAICLSMQDRFADAQRWFESAVRDKSLGDLHGQVNHASLGWSTRQLGECLRRQGKSQEAQLCFERAEHIEAEQANK